MKTKTKVVFVILAFCINFGYFNRTQAKMATTIGTCCYEETSSCYIYFPDDPMPKEIMHYYMKSGGGRCG